MQFIITIQLHRSPKLPHVMLLKPPSYCHIWIAVNLTYLNTYSTILTETKLTVISIQTLQANSSILQNWKLNKPQNFSHHQQNTNFITSWKKKKFSIHESHSTIYSAPMGLAHMMCNTSPPWPFQILSDSELNCLYNVTSSLYHMISSLVSNSSISIQKSTLRYKCFLTDFHVLLYRNHTRDVTKGKKVS